MKKRILFIALAVVLALSVGLIGCVPAQQEEEEEEEEEQEINLDMVTFWPSIDFQWALGHEAWATAVEDLVAADTDWTLTIDISFVGHPGHIWTGVQVGTYDIGASGPGYTPGIMELWAGPEYPAGADICRKNALTMTMAYQALYEQNTALQDEMATENTKVMHFWSTGPGYFLMCEGQHVTTLEDFEALTKPIRAANPGSKLTIAALGAEPLFAPMSVALEKFEAGLMSGILCPTDTPKGFGLSAYVRTATFAPFSYQFVFMKIMNTATWNSLPAEVQACFDEVNAAWPEYVGKLRTWGEQVDGQAYCNDEIDGFFIYDLPTEDPTEYQRWVDACYPSLIDAWIAEKDSALRQEIWDTLVTLDEYYCTTDPWGSWEPGTSAPPVPTF